MSERPSVKAALSLAKQVSDGERAKAKVTRMEALAADLDKKSEAAYERRYVEDWAYHEGRGDTYDEAARLIRAALADEGSADLGT